MGVEEYRDPDASYGDGNIRDAGTLWCNVCDSAVDIGDDGWTCSHDSAMFAYALPDKSNGAQVEQEEAMSVPARKTNYIGSPACLMLDQALMVVRAAFPDALGIYQVGSSLTTPNWRDIDVRLILTDEDFERWFGDPYQQGFGNPFWSLFCAAVSRHLSAASGLPIDFQVQGMTRANILNKGSRQPIGFFHMPKRTETGEKE